MNYAAGYKATYYGTLIDPSTWTETDTIYLISGTVNNTAENQRQSASFQVENFDRTREHWLRVYMDVRQNEDIAHIPIFTGVASAPREQDEGPIATNDLICYSVLEPADTPMTIGDYIARGVNAGQAIRRLLTTPAPVIIDPEAPALQDYIVAEDNETNLTMAQKILDAIGWQMIIHGDGTIHVRPKPTEPAITFGDDFDIIEPNISKARDWFKTPNVLKVTAGDAVAVARDDDPDSPLSVPSRGREIIKIERDVNLGDNEGLAEYAKRRLREEQEVAESVDYTRGFVPELYVGDLIQANYETLQGVYEVKSQTINLTHGGQTQEQADRIEDGA